MAYLDRWKTIFPETVGSETRPSDPIDDSLAFNTDGFPQFIANDPVRYDLQNAFLMQLFSNDARLGELVDALDGALDDHKTDAGAHATGIAGNAGSATKLKTARSIQTNLASTQAENFDGTGNITPGVTGILPVANGGTGQNDLSAVTVGKASQLETARKIDGVSFSGADDIIHYGTCSTAAATAAKTVSCNNYTLTTGSLVFVKFTVTNTAASPTLNVNNTGAKAIQYRGSAIAADYLAENRTYVFVYDGSAYQLIGDINSDTHWTTHLYAGSGTAANATTTNGNTKITVTDNTAVRNSVTIKGTGATTVVSDANGNITINSTDNNTTYSNFVKSGSGAKNGLVPSPGTTAGTAKYLREDCTWQVPPDNNTTYSNFKASGSSAAAGLVPKPSTTAGTTKYLREDASWQVPPGVAGQSLAANGYIKFTNGLIIQWGNTGADTAKSSVNLPISFASSTYAVIATLKRDSDITNAVYSVYATNTSTSEISIYRDGYPSGGGSHNVFWLAVGK